MAAELVGSPGPSAQGELLGMAVKLLRVSEQSLRMAAELVGSPRPPAQGELLGTAVKLLRMSEQLLRLVAAGSLGAVGNSLGLAGSSKWIGKHKSNMGCLYLYALRIISY